MDVFKIVPFLFGQVLFDVFSLGHLEDVHAARCVV